MLTIRRKVTIPSYIKANSMVQANKCMGKREPAQESWREWA